MFRHPEESPLTVVPEPLVVRQRLGKAIREVDLLRRLLRIAEKAKQERDGPDGDGPGGGEGAANAA